MTDALAELITDLRTHAQGCAMIGDNTQSTLATRAADAIVSLHATVNRTALAERTRIIERLRNWAEAMDVPTWRDGWAQEINAAKTFAGQIEDGSL